MDIGASNWNEVDASNTDAAPDGAPEGMAPSGVNNVLRAHQGAVKRFWDRINPTATTGGTTTAYTLSYSVAPSAYVNGELYRFIVNATNGAAATLNVNALGAIPLRLFGGNLLAGALLANDIVTARYNSSAGAFDIIPQNGWVRIGEQDPSAASTVDFTSIPAGVNHLRAEFDWKPGTNAVSMGVQTYGADGVIDTAASDYAWAASSASSLGGIGIGDNANDSIVMTPDNVHNNSSVGIGGSINFQAIQAAVFTKCHWSTTHLYTDNTRIFHTSGSGWRAEADRITGLRFFFSSGTGTGKFTLFASA